MPCFLTSHTLAIPFLCRSTSIMAEKPRFPPTPPVVHRAFVPHLIGSLVQRELAAVRLTEGLTRQNLTPQPVSTTPPSKIGDFFHRPLHRGGIGSAPVVRGKSDKYLARSKSPAKRKTPLPERTNRQGRFHRRNGVGKRNYHVAWGRDCVFCQRAEKLVCGHENSRLLSDSAHYIMPLWISKANVSDS